MPIQLRVVQRCILLEGQVQPGQVLWVPPARARHLVEAGICEVLSTGPTHARLAGPQETKPAGPSETKTSTDDSGPEGRGVLRRSNGWPIDRFAVIEPAWQGEIVAVIAGGPSLTQQQVEATHGKCRVVVVNDQYLIAPWADICYFADARWWEWHTNGVKKKFPWAQFTAEQTRAAFAAFAGVKCTIENTGMMVRDPNVFMLHNHGRAGLSRVRNGIHTGSNSGYQAVNLCVLAGARKVLLLGFDMRFDGARSHVHDGHIAKHPEQSYTQYAAQFASMLPDLRALKTEVVNCTPGSAIGCFRRSTLDAELL